MKIMGRVWLFGDNINTDLIFPGEALSLPTEQRCRLVFRGNRPGWVDIVRPGDILVAGSNFGTGSSRPVGSILKELGLGGLLADSINGLCYRNCVNAGFPALQCANVHSAFQEGDLAEIDLENAVVKNTRTGQTLQGIRIPKNLLRILISGGNMEILKKEGYFD